MQCTAGERNGEFTMNETVIYGKSQLGGVVALFPSRVHEGHTYTFAVKRKVKSGELSVRCQRCIATNNKYKKDGTPLKPVPYIWIKDDSKKAQSCDKNIRKPKAVHNEMTASVREELQDFVGFEDVNALHSEVNLELPDKILSRRIFSYHNAKSYERIADAFGDLPEELKVPLSPKPVYGNAQIENRWILFQETTSTNEPMIIMATVAGLACVRECTHIACDGNFKYNPSSENATFLQVYSMHAIYQ
uniref:Alpha-type protein kinase domain-containing protein n=1 Tax=Steinernema glaseri TaxID=37863 RepID=A0A1I7YC40_9BILA